VVVATRARAGTSLRIGISRGRFLGTCCLEDPAMVACINDGECFGVFFMLQMGVGTSC
jgi:hypothetical protein